MARDKRSLLAIGLLVLLTATGCTDKNTKAAVQACESAVRERLTDSNAVFDAGAMAKSATPAENNTLVINSAFKGSKIENGASKEYQQKFSCTLAMKDAAGASNPSVIRVVIDW
jgi:hypothetical protein